jgi:hypothetical protein
VPDDVRRFPLPWTIESNDACFWVRDADGKRFAFTYYSDPEKGSIGSGYGLALNRTEALRIVRNIVKLPELLKRLAGDAEHGP